MIAPAVAGLGVPLLVTAKSQTGITGVLSVVELLAAVGSVVVAETVEVAVIVPAGTEGATLTTITMAASAPAARLGLVHVTEVVTVHVHPTGADTEEKVVFVGIGSVKLTPEAAAGPLFVMV
jgi:hypothetical protein